MPAPAFAFYARATRESLYHCPLVDKEEHSAHCGEASPPPCRRQPFWLLSEDTLKPLYGTAFVAVLLQCFVMTLQHFRALEPHKQNRKLIAEGVCIADRKREEVQALLFQVDNFYVEVFFLHGEDEVLFTRCFEDTEELEPYLQDIDVSRVI